MNNDKWLTNDQEEADIEWNQWDVEAHEHDKLLAITCRRCY